MAKTIVLTILIVTLLGAAGYYSISEKQDLFQSANKRQDNEQFAQTNAASPVQAKVRNIPVTAEIVFHFGGHIYTMDRNGNNVSQMTFEKEPAAPDSAWEHVAVSPDRRYIAANEQICTHNECVSRLWVYDSESGTRTRLVPNFYSAGGGGVDWDSKGYIYFAAREKKAQRPINVSGPQDMLRALVGPDEVYKIMYDGTGLKRVTDNPDIGAADVAVSADGRMVVFTEPVSGIHIVNTDGTNLKSVPNTGGADPEFSPDGKKLIFTRPSQEDLMKDFRGETEGIHEAWITNLDGTGLRRISPKGEWALIPNWKNDLIIYTEAKDAVIINADGTNRRKIKVDALFSKWIPSQ